MNRRPVELVYLSLILGAVALALPVQVFVIYGHTLLEFRTALAKLTLLNWLVAWGSFGCALLVWRASPKSVTALRLLTAVVAVNNFFVGYYAIDYSPWAAAGGVLAFGFLNYPLWRADIRELIRHPERRWWLRAPRFRMSVPVMIGSARRAPFRAETFDVSESGVFIPLRETALRAGEMVSLRFTFGSLSPVRCDGRVVRRGDQAKGMYPAGIGVEFTGMDWRQRRELRRHLAAPE